jgi:hypothetical protein
MEDNSLSHSRASIRINGDIKLYLDSYHYHQQDKTKHGALLQQLTKGNRIEIHGHGDRYYMDSTASAFGVFQIG